MYRWELDSPAQQEFADLPPAARASLAAFMDAVVIVDPVYYQRLRAAHPRGDGEVSEGLWRLGLESIDGWTLHTSAGAEDERGPFARLLGGSP